MGSFPETYNDPRILENLLHCCFCLFQSTGAGLPGVTGRAVRKHVEWVIKLNTELALIRHHNMAERTVKGISINQDNARIRSTAQVSLSLNLNLNSVD